MDTSSPQPESPRPGGALAQVSGAWVSVLIIVINLAVFAFAEAKGSTKDTATLLTFGAVWRGAVWSGEYWRLVTSMFLHIGPLHLFWNAWFGFRMSRAVERDLGPLKFTVLYLASGVVASAASVIGHNAVAAGASGALFGLIGARYLGWRLALGSWQALWNEEPIRKDITMVGLWFVLGAYAGFDNFAHGGGLVAGIVVAWAIARLPAKGPAIVAAVFTLAAVALALKPLPVIHERDRQIIAAQAAVDAADWPRVVELTEPLLVIADPWVLESRARALINLNRPKEALPFLDREVELDPKLVSAYRLRASAHQQLGHHQKALADLDRALETWPEDTWSLSTRIEIELALWKMDAALKDAERLVKLEDVADNHFTLTRIALRLGDRARVFRELDRAIELDPKRDVYRWYRVVLLAAFGVRERALEGVAQIPQTADGRYMRCMTQALLDEAAAAAAECDAALKEKPDFPRAHLLRGWLRLVHGDADGAGDDFLLANTLASGMAGLTMVALRAGDLEQAATFSASADELDPLDSEVLMARAELLLAHGKRDEAAEVWELAREHGGIGWLEGRAASAELRALAP